MRRQDPISALPGVGDKRARAFNAMGIQTVGDLLGHYPRDYDDRSQLKTVAELSVGAVNTIRGCIAAEPENVMFNKARPVIMTKARLRDHTGELELVWFNQPYLKKYFIKNTMYAFTGKVSYAFGRLQMEAPDYEKQGDENLSSGRIVPVYTTVKSISQKTFRGFIHTALTQIEDEWPDDLPQETRRKYALCGIKTAIHNIHFPESDKLFLSARRRLVFEELFFMQAALFSFKKTVAQEGGVVFADQNLEPLLASLPFPLTRAQQQVLETIRADVTAGRRMNRLVQGDVGSGKTAVAMAAGYLAAINGYQAAIMAPTEVLAQQHYESFSRFFQPLGIHTVLLTGSVKAKERREALAEIAEGRAGMVVGTHALIQAGVNYKRLALVITDEQHRFGVNQRLTLSRKGKESESVSPHTLVMTATPIPRTLGLILYGDMDISVINEMPPGRVPIKTYAVNSSYRARVHRFIQKETGQRRQAYVICPAIEESEADIHSVLRYTKELSEALPGVRVACLHGRMKPAEKQEVMDEFKAGEIQVIVSTTVIEVGVHVANASLMVIENADRFGLSQLHQLRGRVGRGTAQSYCILVTDTPGEQTQARMRAMTHTSDGFALSEMDLEMRGAGDFFGTRQHGIPSFGIANLYRDMPILAEAQEAAANFNHNPCLEPEENGRVQTRIQLILKRSGETVL